MTKRKSAEAPAAPPILTANGYAHEGTIGVVYLVGCRCRCGHEWFPRVKEKPRVCPECKSANWDRPFQFRRAEK